jgi:Aspartyl protease
LRTYTLLRLSSGLLATRVAIHGPLGATAVQLILDTGAVYTVIHPKFLERTGVTPAGEVPVRTLERTLHLPVFTVERVSLFGSVLGPYTILGYVRAAFTSGVDGVLSIGLLRSLAARLDFASGVLTIP